MEVDELLPAAEVAHREFNSLRGRLCNAIESVGLPKKQERHLIMLIKNLSYQNQAVIAELIKKLDDGTTMFRYMSERLEETDGRGSQEA